MLWLPARLAGGRQRRKTQKKEIISDMTGAMYAGISGLKTHMQNLNVIGHNLANVNTYGYKSQRMIFRESLYGTTVAGSNGTTTRGGVNPSQIGYGVQVGTIDLNMATSTYTPTGYPMDCMINGDGFLLVGDKDQKVADVNDLTSFDLTRLGDLNFDPNGYLVDGAGRVVYGFATVQNPAFDSTKPVSDDNSPTILSTELVPLRLPLAAMDAKLLGQAGVDANGDPKWVTGAAVYPALEKKTGTVNPTDPIYNVDGDKLYTYTTDANGNVTATANQNADIKSPEVPNQEGKVVKLKSIKIGENGIIQGVNENGGETVTIGCLAVARVVNPDGVTHVDGPYYRAMEGAGDITVGAPGGTLNGKFLNNKTSGSVDETIGDASTIRSNGLEASSADVATEFASMITTQRGYQANTRLITVTDSMLEELVNMKR